MPKQLLEIAHYMVGNFFLTSDLTLIRVQESNLFLPSPAIYKLMEEVGISIPLQYPVLTSLLFSLEVL
jgi:hypothetical protein